MSEGAMDKLREQFEKWKRSTMSDWKEAQDAALSKEVVKDIMRYRDPIVDCQWNTWQAAAALYREAGRVEGREQATYSIASELDADEWDAEHRASERKRGQ